MFDPLHIFRFNNSMTRSLQTFCPWISLCRWHASISELTSYQICFSYSLHVTEPKNSLSSSETPYFSRFDQGATSPTALDDRFPGIASYAHIDTGYTFSKSPSLCLQHLVKELCLNWLSTNADFQKRDNPFVFFRPGQVFSIQCKGLLSLRTEQEDPTKIDWNNLPLSRVRGIKERSSLARQHRLEQILGLPLDAMFKYAIITGDDKIICSLCPNDNSVYTKEMWIEQHFYLKHWDIYSSLPTTGNKLSRNWISLDDIKSDYPFGPNPEDSPSFATDVWVGSIFLRRFIVVREGTKSCLCLGVHTWVASFNLWNNVK